VLGRKHRILEQSQCRGPIAAAIGSVWGGRRDRYSELRTMATGKMGRPLRRVEMSHIGG